MQVQQERAHDRDLRWRAWCVADPMGEQTAQPTGKGDGVLDGHDVTVA